MTAKGLDDVTHPDWIYGDKFTKEEVAGIRRRIDAAPLDGIVEVPVGYINRIGNERRQPMTQPDGNVPNSPRYERWLNEAASTFKNPERAKRQIEFFMAELHRADEEAEARKKLLVQCSFPNVHMKNAVKAEVDRLLGERAVNDAA